MESSLAASSQTRVIRILALRRTYALKLNPGGEVFYTSFVMTGDMDMMKAPLDKLMTETDLKELGIDFKKGTPDVC